MARTAWVIAAVLGSASAFSFSFAGNDWTFTYAGFARATTQLGNANEEIGASNPATVTQTEINKFVFPVDLEFFAGSGDFEVSGNTVTDTNNSQIVGPLTVDGVTVRLVYPTWQLIGDVVGINTGLTDDFGARAYYVLGRPVLVNNIIVQTQFLGSWIDVGTAELELTSWSLARPVPEPASLAVLGLGAVAMMRRKRNTR